jgi:hypothetical protein
MKLFSALTLLLIIGNANGQQFGSDFGTIVVNKKVKEFPDKFNLSSPLNSFVTLKYILINGKDGLQCKMVPAKKTSFVADSTAPDQEVPEDVRQQHLNTIIQDIIFYKDSVAFITSKLFQDNGDAFYSVRNFRPEHGKWVVNGEDLFHDVESANKYILQFAGKFYRDFQLSKITE